MPLLRTNNKLNNDNIVFRNNIPLISLSWFIAETRNEVNNDLRKIDLWAHQWKMSFNPDIPKQAYEVVFSRKIFKISHPSLTFNNIPVAHVASLKHLGISSDSMLNFNEHLRNIQSKVN